MGPPCDGPAEQLPHQSAAERFGTDTSPAPAGVGRRCHPRHRRSVPFSPPCPPVYGPPRVPLHPARRRADHQPIRRTRRARRLGTRLVWSRYTGGHGGSTRVQRAAPQARPVVTHALGQWRSSGQTQGCIEEILSTSRRAATRSTCSQWRKRGTGHIPRGGGHTDGGIGGERVATTSGPQRGKEAAPGTKRLTTNLLSPAYNHGRRDCQDSWGE